MAGISYIETYIILGRTYGVEDYKMPGEHFFPDRAKFRYKCWAGGCGICEGHPELETARRHIHTYARESLIADQAKVQLRAGLLIDALSQLGPNYVTGLPPFRFTGKKP